MLFIRSFCSFKLWFFLVLNIIKFNEMSCERPLNDFESPRASDLQIFVNTLKKITDYAINNVNAVDMNLMLGIFLAKVNLEASKRELGAPEAALLEEVVSRCDVILRNYLLEMAIRNVSDSRETWISALFTNSTAWAIALPPYNPSRAHPALHLPSATPFRKNAFTWQWNMYRDAVRQYEAWVPSPQLSDECLTTLANDVGADSVTDLLRLRQCNTSIACYTAVYHGTWFGYALTHRLLIMTSGLFSRHCYLHTPSTDARLMRQLCASAYTETAFIAHNQYPLRDLFMEQISICSLLGHVEFLDRSWLFQIVGWQHSAGCFQEEYQQHSDQQWTLVNRKGNVKRNMNKAILLKYLLKNLSIIYSENSLMNYQNDNSIRNKDRPMNKIVKNIYKEGGEREESEQKLLTKCNSHVTAVAAAAISAAVRFIIQLF